MRLLRAYHPGNLNVGDTVHLTQEESHHVTSVLRAKSGYLINLFNGEGLEVGGTITELAKRSVSVRIDKLLREEPRPVPRVLACALTKSSGFDDMIQRAVELGMTEFWPLMTVYTVIQLDEKRAEKKQDRWRRITIEALKQSERLWMPEIQEPMDLDGAVEMANDRGICLFSLLERHEMNHSEVTDASVGRAFLIGPEGGWNDVERSFLLEKTTPFDLGIRSILRTETAALAALAVSHLR